MNKSFIHLRTLSSYSLSESTLKIKKLVGLAKQKNMPAISITDNNNMFGVFEFSQECINNNIQPIIGSAINLLDIKYRDKISQLSFLVKNEQGYKNFALIESKIDSFEWLYLSSKGHKRLLINLIKNKKKYQLLIP